MKFSDKLDDTLTVADLGEVDERLDTDSDLVPVKSGTKSMAKLDKILEKPLEVNTNLQREKPRLSDDIMREAREDVDEVLDDDKDLEDKDDLEDLDLEDDEDYDEDDDEDYEDDEDYDEELNDEDFEDLGEGSEDLEEPDDSSLTNVPGSTYALPQAKAQLDGIIKQWMHLSGNYPEGSDDREKFQEIGERLEEISRVLQRDFIGAKI